MVKLAQLGDHFQTQFDRLNIEIEMLKADNKEQKETVMNQEALIQQLLSKKNERNAAEGY